MKSYLLPSILAASFLFGCSENVESKYLGRWVSVKRDDYKLEIVKNGGNYLVKETFPRGDGPFVESYPATIKNGMVQVENGVGTVNFSIIENTGNLTQGSRQWRRAAQQ